MKLAHERALSSGSGGKEGERGLGRFCMGEVGREEKGALVANILGISVGGREGEKKCCSRTLARRREERCLLVMLHTFSRKRGGGGLCLPPESPRFN